MEEELVFKKKAKGKRAAAGASKAFDISTIKKPQLKTAISSFQEEDESETFKIRKNLAIPSSIDVRRVAEAKAPTYIFDSKAIQKLKQEQDTRKAKPLKPVIPEYTKIDVEQIIPDQEAIEKARRMREQKRRMEQDEHEEYIQLEQGYSKPDIQVPYSTLTKAIWSCLFGCQRI